MKEARTSTSHRQLQFMTEKIHDPYKARLKLQEPSACSVCSAIYAKGRWQWGDRPAGAHLVVCPACRREQDHYPAGTVRIEGAFLDQHRVDVMNLVRHHEERMKAEHPLERIMAIEEHPGYVLVKTTDFHLARGIGEALEKAYRGALDYHYNEGEARLEVKWAR
jgi:hypothetical protein